MILLYNSILYEYLVWLLLMSRLTFVSFCCQYQRAVAKALVDRVPDEKASELTTVRYMSMFCFHHSLHVAFSFISVCF